jgi:hypothetical protein
MGTSKAKLRDQFNAAKDSLGCSPQCFVDEAFWTISQKNSIVSLRRDTHKTEQHFIGTDKFGNSSNVTDAFCFWLDEMDIQYGLVCHIASKAYYVMTIDGGKVREIDLKKVGIR